MKRPTLLLLAAVLVSILTLGGCGPGAEEPAEETSADSTRVEVTDDLLARGHELYRANCVPCHGPGGKGDGPSAAGLDPKPRDHTDPQIMEELTDKRIAETIRMGGIISGYPNMPASPHLRGEDLVGLVAFVRSLHRPEVEAVDVEGVGQ